MQEAPTPTTQFVAMPLGDVESPPQPSAAIAVDVAPAPNPSPHADQATAAAAMTMSTPPRLALSWRQIGVSVSAMNATTKKLEPRCILGSVSGDALPGELTVLMGPSGAGKSTLLDCLSARNRRCSGRVLINGQPWSSKLHARRAGYVQQDDLFYATLTALEHLELQAELRMPREVTPEQRHARVAQILSELGLTSAANTPIGSALVKGLSGGQRKRLSLATELLSNPSVLFVDEPTSGLDSFMADAVVAEMRALAHRGRTIIATIHQPSSTMFQMFDRLSLLADGAVVYDGPACDALAYFAALGLPCASFMNPSEHFMQQLAGIDDIEATKARVRKLTDAWRTEETIRWGKTQQQERQRSDADTNGATADANAAASLTEDTRPSALRVVCILCKRNVMRLVRDPISFRARFGSTLFITLMVGLVFLQLDLSQKGVQDFTGAIFFMAVNQVMGSANPEFISVPLEIPLIMREHQSHLYHVLSWYVAKNVSELPLQLVFPAIFVLPAYFMVGFGANAAVFFTFYLFCVLLASCATGLGLMVSCLSPRVEVTPILGILILLPCLLFGGLFLNAESTPSYFIWLQQISPIKYGHHGMMRGFWSHVDSIPCEAGVKCIATSGDDVLDLYSIHRDRMWSDIIIVIALNIAFRGIGALFLLKRALQGSRT